VIHSVVNPLPRLTGALHVYGGDFFAMHRSEWDSETLREERFDADKAVRRFDEAAVPRLHQSIRECPT
jgi:predicted metal-dependent enzyme (double-stranded beta helix superfamily)